MKVWGPGALSHEDLARQFHYIIDRSNFKTYLLNWRSRETHVPEARACQVPAKESSMQRWGLQPRCLIAMETIEKHDLPHSP